MSERLICVIRLGFEPKTHSLEGCCSIQLSYRTDPYLLSFGGLFLLGSRALLSKVGANIVYFFESTKFFSVAVYSESEGQDG